jgi:hypothetical protein
MHGVDTVALMQQLAQYNVQVTDPAQALIVANRTRRTVLGNHCVSHLIITRRMFRR